MITARDIGGDEDLALRVLAHARSIAPRLDDISPGVLRDSAIAIIRAAAREGATSSRTLKSQRVGPAAVEYTGVASWFSDDDKIALRALCGIPDAAATSGPVGSFPTSGTVARVWPERYA